MIGKNQESIILKYVKLSKMPSLFSVYNYLTGTVGHIFLLTLFMLNSITISCKIFIPEN